MVPVNGDRHLTHGVILATSLRGVGSLVSSHATDVKGDS